MNFALYLDPTKNDAAPDEMPRETPRIAYYRLFDCTDDQLEAFNAEQVANENFTVAEIHADQLDKLKTPFRRLSIVQQKSALRDLGKLRDMLGETQCDISFTWDRRFTVDYYIKLLRFWIQYGIQHFSFYGLTDFDKWQRLQKFMNDNGYFFYDRFHACKPGFESPYQKHNAAFGNVIALGGASRLTEKGVTRIKGARGKNWRVLSPEEQFDEAMLCALADRDGIELAAIEGYIEQKGIDAAWEKGLAKVSNGQLAPTDQGLWDTVGLLAALRQV